MRRLPQPLQPCCLAFARPIELPAMIKAKTDDAKANAALPVVTGKVALPTVAQSTKAGTAIAAAFPA